MIPGLLLRVSGNWAHFRKPETSNNPLSHDFITKTALIGMIGAVLGIDREQMRPLFPQLSEDLRYGVQVRNAVKKQSWGFTFRSLSEAFAKAPKQMELIRDPDYSVLVGLANDRSTELFEQFTRAIRSSQAHYTPVLGLHNCPAELQFSETGTLEFISDGEFETQGFITTQHKPKLPTGASFRVGFERIPTYQNDDFWNLPDHYVSVVYPPETVTRQTLLRATGAHYIFNGQSQWVLI